MIPFDEQLTDSDVALVWGREYGVEAGIEID
jgi:hypothetical protein